MSNKVILGVLFGADERLEDLRITVGIRRKFCGFSPACEGRVKNARFASRQKMTRLSLA